MENIEHVVVVMMENRSFDNLLGWLYADVNNQPPHNIPEQSPTTFEGLSVDGFFNLDHDGRKYFACRPTTSWLSSKNPNTVPSPDPHEEFEFITEQIFGMASPTPDIKPTMCGFLKNYATTAAGGQSAAQIMQTYGPDQANVINDLARNFAVCDGWFASVPSQTWPNRGFVHTGSSDGHVNNDNYQLYDIETIFNVLEKQGKSWNVFHNSTLIPSLTYGQFLPRLALLNNNFYHYDKFKQRCADPVKKLPAYSFVEPRFVPEMEPLHTEISYPNDYHPPHNICRGEQFLADVYEAVRTSPYRDKILLVITFDEHGGCYDHVAPPSGAAAPEPGSVSHNGFKFDRFGVRVPAIVISSYIKPGTVFRAETGKTPYDHTSILATLRDWLKLNPFLPSPRIKAAPTLDRVLTLSEKDKRDWPQITVQCTIGDDDESTDIKLSSVQKSLIATAIRKEEGPHADTQQQLQDIETYQHALDFQDTV